ncbi:Decaprenyl-diphosphate synthase subunit 1 [Coccomyxa sp. Obi]|nr:Decaprenyl-diphosphate synthase subunit 1 [Coccomyxa sp. Obi]
MRRACHLSRSLIRASRYLPEEALGAASAVLPDAGHVLSVAEARCREDRQQQHSEYASVSQPHLAVTQGWDLLHRRQPVDPFSLVKEEIESVSERLRRSIFTGIPTLRSAAEYFFKMGAEGKRLRPTMLLLMASSLSAYVPSPDFLTVDDRPPNVHPSEERRRQQRIAEITEMIHVASLLHDDVIDNAEVRRGLRALNSVFGNKIAILAGDFLLARASVSLAALRNSDVIQLLSQVIEDLVTGEILQISSTDEDLLSLDYYVRKTFHKTASLMANSAKAVAILGGQSVEVSELAWQYGRHLGLAFQFVDDVLDFTGSTLQLGKPALNDLHSGLATAPVLFAAEEHPQLRAMILRKFKSEGDVELAQQLVFNSNGIQRARDLAAEHASLAAQAVQSMPPAVTEHAMLCRQALTDIAARVLTRKK